ncbi:thiamine biosynthesis protein ThiS [Marinobacter salinus]|uniref:Thiamine biosynthesis protein ThiS n=1 Tax=Marinobacter salinus TaxID=1874317 RepID=A0A1D9GQJ3_9GAMM|nr:sulfur carrier protein ThiS [Marinobacter salinus]AOY89791.1 thiamine biosynthesis protein ThiS [Marinobacter salinus]
MQVQVNGDAMELPAGATIVTLIEKMTLAGKRLAVEVNEDIVPRSQHPEFSLHEGDRVEVVHAIGGG